MTTKYHKACMEADLVEGISLCATLNSRSVLLTRVDGEPVAIENRCTHQYAALSEGRIRRGTIACPLHGARFDLKSGDNIGGQYPPICTFNIRTEAGWVEVEVPDKLPGDDQARQAPNA